MSVLQRCSVVLMLLLLLGSGLKPASAADSGSTLSITISDEAGAPLAGALIVLTSASIAGERTFETDSQGIANAAQLPPGEYTVRVSRNAFQSATRTLVLRLGRTLRLDIKLLRQAAE
jgi:uncharacterized membrane protein